MFDIFVDIANKNVKEVMKYAVLYWTVAQTRNLFRASGLIEWNFDCIYTFSSFHRPVYFW